MRRWMFMLNPNIELAKKIVFFSTEFNKNPSVYVDSDSDLELCTEENSGLQFIQTHSIETGYFHIMSGEFCKTLENMRWLYYDNDNYDLCTSNVISYNGSDCDVRIRDVCNNDYSDKFRIKDVNFSEEYMFQNSLIMNPYMYDSLEMYLYFKENCTVPFKINLSLFNIDEAVRLYGYNFNEG